MRSRDIDRTHKRCEEATTTADVSPSRAERRSGWSDYKQALDFQIKTRKKKKSPGEEHVVVYRRPVSSLSFKTGCFLI